MPTGIANKVAVVTGGSSGIGQAYAQRLAEEGADVAIADILPASETKRLVEHAGRRCFAQQCDVSSQAEVKAFAQAVQQHLGTADILVNNAGIYPTAPFLEMTADQWHKVLTVNLDSVFHMCQAFAPGMKGKGWGRVVNIGSGSVLRPPEGMAHYVASKAAIVGLTRALAVELGQYGIVVNCIEPGLTATNTVLDSPQGEWLETRSGNRAIKRVERPDDLVGPLVYLCSDDAGFFTGQTLLVDGGGAFL
jgi:3-oxoacyl-[acyl-carrier protein] reductase/(S)-1-phenylethanol dehydrogenase